MCKDEDDVSCEWWGGKWYSGSGDDFVEVIGVIIVGRLVIVDM